MVFHVGEDNRKQSSRFRRSIAKRGGSHIKGMESIYTSDAIAIEVGSAGEGQTGLGRRPKVLARSTVKYCEVLARSTVKY
jgi:hypothetical protein